MVTEYGKRLKEARKQLGLTQKELAAKTGIPLSTIATAETQGTGSSYTATFAQALSVDAHWLSTGRGSMTPEFDQLNRYGNLREYLNRDLGLLVDDDLDAIWLSEKLNKSFEFCEKLLCGDQVFTAGLAREIEVKLGLAVGSLDEYETHQDEAIEDTLRSAARDAAMSRKLVRIAGLPENLLDSDSTTSNVNPGPKIRGSVPLLSTVQAGMFREVLDNYSGDSVEQIPTTVPVNRYTFALRVQGDSMEPKFTAGMLLIVEPELDPQNNDFVIVKNGSDETTFKQLVKDGDDWLLKPLNDRYPIKPLGKNTIVGVVRGVTEQFR